jgi:hypothetical protein
MTTHAPRPAGTPGSPIATRAARVLGLALVLLALGAVFVGYLDPQLVLALANQAWSCL